MKGLSMIPALSSHGLLLPWTSVSNSPLMFRSVAATCLIWFCISACDHLGVEANNDPQGYADSQVVGKWKITACTSDIAYDWDGNGVAETDVYNTWTACQKDHLYEFVGNKTGTYRLSCSLTKSGSWEILDTKYLVYTPDGQSGESERIVALTSNEFKTTKFVSVSAGQNIMLSRVWTRQ